MYSVADAAAARSRSVSNADISPEHCCCCWCCCWERAASALGPPAAIEAHAAQHQRGEGSQGRMGVLHPESRARSVRNRRRSHRCCCCSCSACHGWEGRRPGARSVVLMLLHVGVPPSPPSPLLLAPVSLTPQLPRFAQPQSVNPSQQYQQPATAPAPLQPEGMTTPIAAHLRAVSRPLLGSCRQRGGEHHTSLPSVKGRKCLTTATPLA